MDSSVRGNQPMYAGRTPRRGSTGSGSIHRGDDGAHSGMGNVFQGNMRAGGGDNHYTDLLKTIYVSNITATMPDDALWEAFGQFGRVESLVRRDVNVDMNNNTEQQYAFIRYRNRQDARYAISTGEINFYGRKLVIRPRDKPTYIKHNVNGNMHDRTRDFEGFEKARSRSFHATERRFEQRGSLGDQPNMSYPMSPEQIQSPPAPAPAEMLSKILTVANLPADMSPKELFELFASYGSVERSYIYQQADALGRRFGEVTMASFFFAQKAFEGLNCYAIRGVPLDVSYKANPHSLATVSPDQMGVPRNYAWAIAPHMQWPYPIYNHTTGPTIPTSGHAGSQYSQNSGIVLPAYAVWNPPHSANAAGPAYGYPGVPLQVNSLPSPAHIPLCVYPPPHGNGAPFHRAHTTGNLTHIPKTGQGNVGGEAADVSSLPESASRSVSGASSTTLVASHESGMEKKYQPPVIVTSPTYPRHGEDLKQKLVTPPTSEAVHEVPLETVFSEHASGSSETGLDSPSKCEFVNVSVPVATPGTINTPGFDPTKPPFVPETSKPRDPSNLYIKNLDDTCITNTMDLKLAFGQFGQIASAFLATYPNGASKGFGFVAFANPSDAVAAKEHLDGVVVGRKRVFVTFAERKEERTQRLKELFENKKDPDSKDGHILPNSIETDDGSDSGALNPELIKVKPNVGATKDMAVPNMTVESTYTDQKCREPADSVINSQTEGEVTVTTTVTTTKAWKGTQLQGIVEVEEEESPCTKKFRQQRSNGQNLMQQSQVGCLPYKDSRSITFTNINAPTSPSSTKSIPDYPVTPTGTRTEACAGSPPPLQQRNRQNGVQPQRRSQSPRNGPRPFYPPGRSDSGSPKPIPRPLQTYSPTPVPGAPTGPRSQFSGNRASSVGSRDANQKKKKAGRRNNEGIQNSTASEGDQLVNKDNKKAQEERRAAASAQLDSLETHSAP